MEFESKEEILNRRKEIEQELLDLLREIGSDFTLDQIKEIIYNEEGQGDLADVISMFDTGQDIGEFNEILETVNDAWNYFPHKVLDGLFPAKKILGYRNSQK